MFSMLSKAALAFSMMMGLQQANAAGDQSGLLANLYNAKLDYQMNMQKGLTENARLTNLLYQTHGNLAPYQGQQIQMDASWAYPLRQTEGTFRMEIATEDAALRALFSNLNSIVDVLRTQKANCAAVDYRFEGARNEMRRVWYERIQDSNNLLREISSISDAAERANGRILVSAQLLNQIQSVAAYSSQAQSRYSSDLSALDARLTAIIEDIRVCYNID